MLILSGTAGGSILLTDRVQRGYGKKNNYLWRVWVESPCSTPVHRAALMYYNTLHDLEFVQRWCRWHYENVHSFLKILIFLENRKSSEKDRFVSPLILSVLCSWRTQNIFCETKVSTFKSWFLYQAMRRAWDMLRFVSCHQLYTGSNSVTGNGTVISAQHL